MSQTLTQTNGGALDAGLPLPRPPLASRRGSLGAASAMGVLALVGALCLAADPASSHLEERRTRTVVESSAMAGAAALATGGDVVDAATDALLRAGLAGGDRGRDSLVVNRPPQAGAYAGHADAVEVVLVRAPAVGMAHMALGAAMPLRIRAVAAVVTVLEACPGAVDRGPCMAQEAASQLRAPLLVE